LAGKFLIKLSRWCIFRILNFKVFLIFEKKIDKKMSPIYFHSHLILFITYISIVAILPVRGISMRRRKSIINENATE
jgi:hypothetical protein